MVVIQISIDFEAEIIGMNVRLHFQILSLISCIECTVMVKEQGFWKFSEVVKK